MKTFKYDGVEHVRIDGAWHARISLMGRTATLRVYDRSMIAILDLRESVAAKKRAAVRDAAAFAAKCAAISALGWLLFAAVVECAACLHAAESRPR